MNQKGFGLKEFIIIIAVVFISLIAIVSLYKSIIPDAKIEDTKTQTTPVTYKQLEKELEQAAERYQNDNYSGNVDDVAVWELSYSMLKENKYIDKLIDPKDKTECTGYVEFVQDKAQITYKPFIKCGSNYTTKGYDGDNNIE